MSLRRKPAWSEKMLGVLVILMLIPTWTDGVLMTKCELRSKLKAALPEFQEKTSDDIAKLVRMVENISGFNTSFVTITSFNPETLIRAPFPYNEDLPSGFGELSGLGEESAVHVERQYRKKRGVPSGWDGSLISEGGTREGPTNKPKKTLKNNGLPGPTNVNYDTYEMLFGRAHLTTEPTKKPEDIAYDTYEMLFGPTDLPPETTVKSEDIVYDTYEMIFGRAYLTTEPPNMPTDIVYDTYEMLFGPTDKPSLDGPQDTTGQGKGRFKRSSDHRTVFYGIFQLNGVTCDSGSSNSPNICGLRCSALTDDDITDDISCLKTLKEKGKTFLPSWLNVDPSQYFAECG